ncbi:hypothetical protein TNCV_1600521 [Trichonephila clavipes]|nr:hypothetical protein TNCV_1600521 [Trichonephila clavipes]
MRIIMDDDLDVLTVLSVHETDIRFRPTVHNGQFLEVFRLQPQVSVHWYRVFGSESVMHPIQLWVFGLFETAQYLQLLHLKIRVPPGFDAPDRTFDDLVVASLDIFPLTTEQQHVHFSWLGRR